LDGEPTDLHIKDIDDDDVDDLLISTNLGSLYALDLSGDFKWVYRTGKQIHKIGADDLNGDSISEIVLITEGPIIEAYEINKSYTVRRRADTFFSFGQDAFINSDDEKALYNFNEARKLYIRLGDEKRLLETNAFIERIEIRKKEFEMEHADSLYSRAEEYFYLEDYQTALDLVNSAAELYEKLIDNEGLVKSELLRLQIERRMALDDPKTTLVDRSTTSTTLAGEEGDSLIAIGLFSIMVFAAFILVAAKKKAESDRKKQELKSPDGAWEEQIMDLEKEMNDQQ
jgi:tetratricopeptide (TPR) repeat protein